ncbi:MAG: FadR family transcriptional regulator [Rhizobiales bacterium]|nr:FadR family transcriptional regulator [Hyphomicrobiales bacterium]NRB15326.1 FadR family transcriptional regulator [Hyphomicrobiales bacterium]
MSNPALTAKTSNRIINHFQAQLASGVLNAGDKLPSERKLAAQFNVSRASIREAIGLMELKGMVKIRHGASTIIVDIFNPSLLDPLQVLVNNHQGLAANVMAVRHLLEVEATKLAALNATENDIISIEKSLTNLLNADLQNADLQVKADIEFHLAIADASQNIVLAKLMRNMGELLEQEMAKTISAVTGLANDDGQAKLNQQHIAIFTAIKASNSAEAEQAARAHLQFVQSHLA